MRGSSTSASRRSRRRTRRVAGPDAPVAAAATRVYASPEVLAGETPEPRDDVFSLGCVIHEMVAGRHPYGRLSADRVRDSSVVPERLASLGQARASAVSSALSLARAARPTMAELRAQPARRRRSQARTRPACDGRRGRGGIVFGQGALAGRRARCGPRRPRPRTGLKRSRVALWSGLAAGLALVLGILIGRLDPGRGSATVMAPSPPRAAEPETRPAAQLPAADAEDACRRTAGRSASNGRETGRGDPGGRLAWDRLLRRAENDRQQPGGRGGDPAASPQPRAARA